MLIIVGAAIVRGGQLLAQQRARPRWAAGRWELPGGAVEHGETDADALVRECHEELGVEVRPGRRVGPDVWLPGDRLLRAYAATLVDPMATPRPVEHSAVRWVASAELAGLDWLDADRALLPDLRGLLRG